MPKPDPFLDSSALFAGVVSAGGASRALLLLAVTLNRRHFMDDPRVAARARLPIGTPGDALAWVRGRLAGDET